MLKACLFTGLQCVAKCGVTNRAWERHFLLSARFKIVTAGSALESAGGCTYIHITHTYAYTYSYIHICMHTHTPRLIYTCPYIWIIASRVICYCFHNMWKLFPVYSYCIDDFSSMLSLLSWGAKHVFFSLIVWCVAFYLFLGCQVGWAFARGCIVSCMW